MLLRAEIPADRDAIRRVVTAAFGQPDEAVLVDALRDTAEYIPELSLVAELTGQVAGHLLFTRAPIVGRKGETPALALAPLAVSPEHQRHGVGTALMNHGLAACARLGHRLVVVLGHATYYPRFGFVAALPRGIEAPFPVRSESFMLHELVPGAAHGIHGTIRYAAPFAAV